jgi:glutamate/tyrosine decarboxylase-like PLP-dependent enzyme
MVDNIEKISEICKNKGIGCHVDASRGGLSLHALVEDQIISPFDFILKGKNAFQEINYIGVTSLSLLVDENITGCGCVLFKNKRISHVYKTKKLKSNETFMPSMNLSGRINGGMIATMWSSLLFTGSDILAQNAKKILNSTQKLASAIKNTPGVQLLGNEHVRFKLIHAVLRYLESYSQPKKDRIYFNLPII